MACASRTASTPRPAGGVLGVGMPRALKPRPSGSKIPVSHGDEAMATPVSEVPLVTSTGVDHAVPDRRVWYTLLSLTTYASSAVSPPMPWVTAGGRETLTLGLAKAVTADQEPPV